LARPREEALEFEPTQSVLLTVERSWRMVEFESFEARLRAEVSAYTLKVRMLE